METDTLRVEGHYFFLGGGSGEGTTALLYPYPADSLLGSASTRRLEARPRGGTWRRLAFTERPDVPAAIWRVPRDLGREFEIRTTYVQSLRGSYARYIVTTTAAWGRPLREARFEVHLPAGVVPTRATFPYRSSEENGHPVLRFEAKDFAPTEDIVVEWERAP